MYLRDAESTSMVQSQNRSPRKRGQRFRGLIKRNRIRQKLSGLAKRNCNSLETPWDCQKESQFDGNSVNLSKRNRNSLETPWTCQKGIAIRWKLRGLVKKELPFAGNTVDLSRVIAIRWRLR